MYLYLFICICVYIHICIYTHIFTQVSLPGVLGRLPPRFVPSQELAGLAFFFKSFFFTA